MRKSPANRRKNREQKTNHFTFKLTQIFPLKMLEVTIPLKEGVHKLEILKSRKLELKMEILKRLVEDDRFFEAWKSILKVVWRNKRYSFRTWLFVYQMKQKAEEIRQCNKTFWSSEHLIVK